MAVTTLMENGLKDVAVAINEISSSRQRSEESNVACLLIKDSDGTIV